MVVSHESLPAAELLPERVGEFLVIALELRDRRLDVLNQDHPRRLDGEHVVDGPTILWARRAEVLGVNVHLSTMETATLINTCAAT